MSNAEVTHLSPVLSKIIVTAGEQVCGMPRVERAMVPGPAVFDDMDHDKGAPAGERNPCSSKKSNAVQSIGMFLPGLSFLVSNMNLIPSFLECICNLSTMELEVFKRVARGSDCVHQRRHDTLRF